MKRSLTPAEEKDLFRAIARGEGPVEDIAIAGVKLDITTGPMSMKPTSSMEEFAPTMLDFAAGFVANADMPMWQRRTWGFVAHNFDLKALSESPDGDRLIECLWDLWEGRHVDLWTLAFSRDLLRRFESRTFDDDPNIPLEVPYPPDDATLHFKLVDNEGALYKCQVKDASGNALWSTDGPTHYDDIRWELMTQGFERQVILEAVWVADPKQKEKVQRAMKNWTPQKMTRLLEDWQASRRDDEP